MTGHLKRYLIFLAKFEVLFTLKQNLLFAIFSLFLPNGDGNFTAKINTCFVS